MIKDNIKDFLKDSLNDYLNNNEYIDYSSLYEIFGLNQDEIYEILCERLVITNILYNEGYSCFDNDSKIELIKYKCHTIYDPSTFLPLKRIKFQWRKFYNDKYYTIEREYYELVQILKK